MFLLALIVGTAAWAVVDVARPPIARAAEVPADPVEDSARCVGASTTAGRVISKCYLGITAVANSMWWSARGSDIYRDGVTNTLNNRADVPMWRTNAGTWIRGTVGGCGSTAQGQGTATWYVGPQTDPVAGVIPDGAMVVICTDPTSYTSGATTSTPSLDAEAYFDHYPSISVGFLMRYCTSTNAGTCTAGGGELRISRMGWGKGAATLAELLAITPWPADWFPGGSAGPLPDWCASLTVTIPTPSQTLLTGTSVEVTFTSTTDPSAIPSGVELDYRWDQAELFRWVPSTSSGAGPWKFMLTNLGPPRTVSAGFEMRCRVSPSALWWYYDAAGARSGSPATMRPCRDVAISWPQFPLAAGVEVTVGVTMGPGPFLPGEDIEGFAWVDRSDPVFPVETDFAGAFHVVTDAPVSFPQTPPGSFLLRFTPSNALEGKDLILVCEDDVGPRNFFGGSIGVLAAVKAGPGDTYGDRLDRCMNSVSFGLDPGTWVGGLMGTMTCVATFLFLPLQDDLDEMFESMRDTFSSRTPTNYVAEALPLVTSTFANLSSVVQANQDACFVILPAMGPSTIGGGGTPAQEICGDDLPLDPEWRPLAVWLFYVGFAWAMVRLVGKVLEGADLDAAAGSFMRSTDARNMED